ncbi:MAG: hypothetical protein AAGG51_29495 [Cyanobacteria bacterium P01_G01_bin.54]
MVSPEPGALKRDVIEVLCHNLLNDPDPALRCNAALLLGSLDALPDEAIATLKQGA